MRVMLLCGLLLAVVSVTGCSKEELKTLTSAEVDALLKGNTVTMESIYVAQSRPFKQFFGANGVTVQMADGKRTGKWRVDKDNQFCVLWDTSPQLQKTAKESKELRVGNVQKETCLQVKQDSQGKYKVFSEGLGYVGTIGKVVTGFPEKLK